MSKKPIGFLPIKTLVVIGIMLVSSTFAAPANAAPPSLTPDDDIDVQLIERYPKMAYTWDSQNPTYDGWPRETQTVTWQANIKNWFDKKKRVYYTWYVDGVEVDSSVVTIDPNTTVPIYYDLVWGTDRHEIEFVVDPDNKIKEFEEGNNSLMVYSDSIAVGFYVEQSVYDYFHAYQNELGVGSNSFEDWAQRQVATWNQIFEDAIYPGSPDGVLDRIRIEEIVLVQDGELPLAGGLPTNSPNQNDRYVDLQWGFPATLLEGTFYGDHTTTSHENPFYYEGSLFHEILHARYLIDTYGFNVHDDGTGNTVEILENGSPIVGTSYMPFVAYDVLHYTPEIGAMSGSYESLSEYSAMALNLIAGWRATVGNWNPPENIGVFLNRDLPDENTITVYDDQQNLLVGADVEVYNATAPSVPQWYSKLYDDTADVTGTTNGTGQMTVGKCPFLNGWVEGTDCITHGYGLSNGTLIIRVSYNGQVGYTFLEATSFNKEYWNGNTSSANHDITVDLQ